ncbi:translation initiation factor 2 alpha subunit [Fadolivirus algeromassiliense]|jgi:translation initiation factor 2 subunit 1|uniref:Translation initiation factor 2 alpha subunit n=1 Tax=Fadolivirus FV1/VV64 TaxID=3070911 RepID=A0A7D3QWU1_9VIRU|nr:translation initiation factor 2 alpha subunit [Fadolivirus algeromassiliense]QKF93780.1 translation initiation factor 2 alpha subunit [Fadolivirus FV1/VV64]
MNIKRFYKNEFPEQDDVVMVKINREDEYGYYADLIEYENLEGFISLSEIVKSKYVKKHILKVGEVLPTVVLKVDTNKKLIDLSKKRMDNKEEPVIMCKYKACTSINKLVNECYIMYLKHCDVSSSDIIHSINDVMTNTVWKLYEQHEDHNYTIIFRDILRNPKIVLTDELFTNDFVDKALNNVTKRVTINNTVMENSLTLHISEENAITKIKEILDITKFKNNSDYKVSVLITSPPNYKVRIEGPSHDQIIEMLKQIKDSIKQKSNAYSCLISFDEPKILCESSYDYKFLGDYDLERFEFK